MAEKNIKLKEQEALVIKELVENERSNFEVLKNSSPNLKVYQSLLDEIYNKVVVISPKPKSH